MNPATPLLVEPSSVPLTRGTARRPARLLAVFPGLDPAAGGIQIASLTALPVIAEGPFEAIVFGADPSGAAAGARQSVIDGSKHRLLCRVARRRWEAEILLVWHIDMLKLLPFIRGFRGRVVMFCLGIELWRPHGWCTRRLLRRVDLFLSISDYTWQRCLEHAPYLRGRPYVTTGLGVGGPLAGVSPTPAATPSAAIVARMSKAEDYKGHRELIGAWPRVLESIPSARLDIVGDGDLRPELEAMVRQRNLGQHVRFLGRVSEESKGELLAASRCLAMPSRGEGFGLVYLEAMRLGRPCLVSDCDAGREVVNPPEAGLAVDVRDQCALAAALVRLLGDGDEWRNWSIAARRRYEANYTAASFQRRLRAALDSIVNQTMER
ncbi:MAG TPA: glycosyltransferase family 4 protein [Pirellulales bacterium]|nr:glycosyltransferase family 4 protein [Pirellulales bacterium]